jgi:hypothetical protein
MEHVGEPLEALINRELSIVIHAAFFDLSDRLLSHERKKLVFRKKVKMYLNFYCGSRLSKLQLESGQISNLPPTSSAFAAYTRGNRYKTREVIKR